MHMHVTPDSPVTDRAAVMLANAVLYAGQDRPDPSTPATLNLPTGPWTPTQPEWTQVCHLVDVIVDHDAVMVLAGILGRLVERHGGPSAALDDLVAVEHWRHACPVHRVGALMYLAWHAHNAIVPTADGHPHQERVDMARALYQAAQAHHPLDEKGWFGPWFPVDLPNHSGATLARRLVDSTDDEGATVGLHVALMLAATEHTRPDYGRVEFPPPPTRTHPCTACQGAGITGETYTQETDTGAPVGALVVDVFCPACAGCGDATHVQCNTEEHHTDDHEQDHGADRCPSCRGRQWWPVQAYADADGDGGGTVALVLRMPCGCASDRVVTVEAETET